MIKTAFLRGALCVFLGVTALPYTALATTPHISLTPLSTTATSTVYGVFLTDVTTALNVFEFELVFATSTTIERGSIESALCRPELAVANTYTAETGVWYVACGNYVPFTGTSTMLATVTVPHADTASQIKFGTNTAVYQHDGYGTILTPTTSILLKESLYPKTGLVI